MLEFYLFQLFCLFAVVIGLLLINRYATQSNCNHTPIKVFIVLIAIGVLPVLGFSSVIVSGINICASIFESGGKFGEWLNSVPFQKKD